MKNKFENLIFVFFMTNLNGLNDNYFITTVQYAVTKKEGNLSNL